MTDSLLEQPVTPMLPANEPERLAALHRYRILDTPAEAAFDRLTTLAARLFKMPTVLISLVDESRAWFKSSIGFSATEVLRDATICSFAVLTNEPLIVPDTRLDDRFVCNPFVQCEPGMRFYAGAPLIDRDGFNLGTLCLLDSVPHDPLTAEQEATLVDLAAMVVDELELRLAAQQIASIEAALVEITQGVARVTGGAFFDELVRHFAKVLGTDYVYIGLIEGTEPKMMRTLVNCDRGNIVENFEYRLQNTPCWEAVEQRKICCYPRNVKAQFPNALLLQSLPVESYIAIPFYGSDGNALGLLGVMDSKPLEHVYLAESLLTIFASRIATELERQQYELMLVEQTRLLEAVSTGQPLDECLSALCSSIAILSPRTRACVLLTDDCRMKFPRSIAPDFAPSLSQGFKDSPINDLESGTCGAAVYCGQPMTCSDIDNDDRWSAGWRDLCIVHGIRACHFVPIMGIDNSPLGSVMLCFDEARLPTKWEYRLGEFGTKIASIAIERLRSIEKLSESEKRLNLALTAADMATCDVDLSTGQTIWSAKQFQILGYDLATDGADNIEMWWNRVHPDDRPAVIHAWETAQRKRSLYRMEHRFIRFDSEQVVWVAATGQFLENQMGKAMRFVGVMFDITDRKRSEKALQTSEEQSRNILESITDAFFSLDQDWRYTYLNPQVERLVDRSPSDLLGKIIWEEYPGLIGSEFETAYYRAANEQIASSVTAFYPDHDRWYELRVYPAVAGVTSYFRDVTDLKRIEVEREQLLQREQIAREAAETANRIKDEFLATLSHELRAPLNPILGWAQLLQVRKFDQAKLAEVHAIIERSAKLQVQLIDDLLDIAKILRGKLIMESVQVDLVFVIESALDTVKSAASAKFIHIQKQLPQSCQVAGDSGRLQQVVWNLLSNAVKFTPQHGQVQIRLEQVGNQAQITVSDTGKGIDPNFLPYIFESFRQEDATTTRKYGGLGLGLAIVRTLVEAHGGTIYAESQGEAKGATFTVHLPLPETDIEGEQPELLEKQEPQLTGVRVLVVDDNLDNHELLTVVLSQYGVEVMCVASASDALDCLDSFTPDVLVSDIGMPDMDGYVFIQTLRSLPPEKGGQIPAIALTSYARQQDIQRAFDSGFHRYVSKPINIDQFVQAVETLVRTDPFTA